MHHDEVIPILDFGSQYSQLIARRVREKGVYSELVRPDMPAADLRKMNARGLILSGGPSSVYEPNAPRCDPAIFDMGIPILGICYGMQLGVQILGGQVKPARAREYGRARLHIARPDALVKGLPDDTTVWMSHGDQVCELPPEFEAIATTATCPYAAARHRPAASRSCTTSSMRSAAAPAPGRWRASSTRRCGACASRWAAAR